jgi:hypothetical protein
MFWTYGERREQAREGRGIAAFVSWLHLVVAWLRSRASQLRDASARKQVGWALVMSRGAALRCARGNQGEAAEAVARLAVDYAGLGSDKVKVIAFSHTQTPDDNSPAADLDVRI